MINILINLSDILDILPLRVYPALARAEKDAVHKGGRRIAEAHRQEDAYEKP